MSTNTIDLSALTLDELLALQARAQELVSQREVDVLTMYLDEVKPKLERGGTDARPRVGAYRSTEFRHNGRLLKVTVNITDVEATHALRNTQAQEAATPGTPDSF